MIRRAAARALGWAHNATCFALVAASERCYRAAVALALSPRVNGWIDGLGGAR